MKKFLLISTAILFSSIICRADFVDEEKASEIASEWFGTKDFDLVLNEEQTLYYINAAAGGWIIVSAEDCVTPVLAYSETGRFNPKRLPSNLNAFLGNYTKSIDAVRADDLKGSAEVAKLWKNPVLRTKSAEGKLLQTASWDQEDPYNQYCPVVTEDGRKYTALTGCVATAMAIIIRYHQWPEHGTGTIGGYSYTSDYRKKVTIESRSIDDHYYDYSKMPMKYTSSYTTAQGEAVATLMYDLGVMFQANYNYNTGTGAYGEDIQKALYEHMGYSGNAYNLYRSACSDAEFLRIIKNEIDEGRPVAYGGVDSSSGGHQFLCDGYDQKDYIHINWGWSGDNNGYFTLSLKIPGQYTFDEDQSILVGLEPDRDGSTRNNGGPLHFIYDSSVKDYSGITITGGSIETGTFTCKVGGIWNSDANVDYTGSVRLAVVNYKGELKEIISETQQVDLGTNNVVTFSNITCNITKDTVFGDRIILQFLAKNGQWEEVNCDTNTVSNFTNSISVVDTPFLLIEDSYKTGDSFILDIVPGNSPVSKYTWTFDGLTQSHVSVSPLTKGEHTVTAKVTLKDGSIQIISQKINVE